jgi:hypothetical protein
MNTFLRMMALVIVAGLGYVRAPNSADFQFALLMLLPVIAAAFYVSLFNMRRRYQRSVVLSFPTFSSPLFVGRPHLQDEFDSNISLIAFSIGLTVRDVFKHQLHAETVLICAIGVGLTYSLRFFIKEKMAR